MNDAETRERVIKVVDVGKQIYVLCTVDRENRPHSRFMGSIYITEDYSAFYMACKAGSNKLTDIAGNPNAQLLFSTPDYLEVAAVSGKAYLETSREMRQTVWDANPGIAGYMPSVDDQNFCVIRFEAEFAQYYALENTYEPVVVSLGSGQAAQAER